MQSTKNLWVLILLAGCAVTPPPSATDAMERDEARALAGNAGKADMTDICASQGWYDDGVCDEFCPEPDGDCASACMTDSDCPQPLCSLGGSCPRSECISNECRIDNPNDECAIGERECPDCGEARLCVPHTGFCPAVICDEPACGMGERACQTCNGNHVCTPEGTDCPFVFCPGPDQPTDECGAEEQECPGCNDSILCVPDGVECQPQACPSEDRCGMGETECAGCNGNYTCAPDGVSCPLVRCPGFGSECTDTCRYSGDGECDDGGMGSDYDVCALGTDCMDCGGR